MTAQQKTTLDKKRGSIKIDGNISYEKEHFFTVVGTLRSLCEEAKIKDFSIALIMSGIATDSVEKACERYIRESVAPDGKPLIDGLSDVAFQTTAEGEDNEVVFSQIWVWTPKEDVKYRQEMILTLKDHGVMRTEEELEGERQEILKILQEWKINESEDEDENLLPKTKEGYELTTKNGLTYTDWDAGKSKTLSETNSDCGITTVATALGMSYWEASVLLSKTCFKEGWSSDESNSAMMLLQKSEIRALTKSPFMGTNTVVLRSLFQANEWVCRIPGLKEGKRKISKRSKRLNFTDKNMPSVPIIVVTNNHMVHWTGKYTHDNGIPIAHKDKECDTVIRSFLHRVDDTKSIDDWYLRKTGCNLVPASKELSEILLELEAVKTEKSGTKIPAIKKVVHSGKKKTKRGNTEHWFLVVGFLGLPTFFDEAEETADFCNGRQIRAEDVSDACEKYLNTTLSIDGKPLMSGLVADTGLALPRDTKKELERTQIWLWKTAKENTSYQKELNLSVQPLKDYDIGIRRTFEGKTYLLRQASNKGKSVIENGLSENAYLTDKHLSLLSTQDDCAVQAIAFALNINYSEAYGLVFKTQQNWEWNPSQNDSPTVLESKQKFRSAKRLMWSRNKVNKWVLEEMLSSYGWVLRYAKEAFFGEPDEKELKELSMGELTDTALPPVPAIVCMKNHIVYWDGKSMHNMDRAHAKDVLKDGPIWGIYSHIDNQVSIDEFYLKKVGVIPQTSLRYLPAKI